MNQAGNVAASVRQRLKNVAATRGENFQAILTRYALERFLYRLSQSDYRERFILKGALLFSIWSEQPHRATRDIDLLGFGNNILSDLEQVFREICQVEVELDGWEFAPETVNCQRIKPDQEYEGVRIDLRGNLALTRTRIDLQIDIGFGDAVSPAPINLQFPTILDFPAPEIPTYPRETVVAEKFQAMVMLGIANSRMKDFYDLWFLATNFEFEGELLATAIKATFNRRRTTLPTSTPLALTPEFSGDKRKITQWKAFLRKGKLAVKEQKFNEIVALLNSFLMPPCLAVGKSKSFECNWNSSLSWQQKQNI